jgi:transcriptional regulator with XRE-family HTH domain
MPRSGNTVLRRFGEAIRAERRRQGISQEQLALLSDLNRTYMGGVERGEENISLLKIVQITDVLHTTPSRLLAGADL